LARSRFHASYEDILTFGFDLANELRLREWIGLQWDPIVKVWFDVYKDILVRMKIEEKNIYNIDETGFSIGTMESTQVIADSTLRTKHQAYPGCQE
jgi:hypothetical protein